MVTRKLFFGKSAPVEKVSSHGSSERRDALVVRGEEMMLTPLETVLQHSPSSADPTAVTAMDISEVN